MDKHIEVSDGHHITAKQKGQFQIKVCGDNGGTFIATLHNVLLETDVCNGLFSIITLMNLVHNCLFQQELCMVYFGYK